MRLVFVHGWGFDRHFWDPLAALLPGFPQSRIDLGFFGEAEDFSGNDPCVLVGHSLGFLVGLKKVQNLAGWVAINSFRRFVPDCVSAAALRRMKSQLNENTQATLADFYRSIGTDAPTTTAPDKEKLSEGLDTLRDASLGDEVLPSLVLAAADDPLVPLTTSEAMASCGAQVLIHPNGAHMLPVTQPVWCAKAIGGFLQENFAP